MTCPSPECHENKDKLERCVDKIKDTLPLFLTKATAKWVIGLMMGILVAFGIAYGGLTLKVERHDTILKNIPTRGDIYRIVNKKLSQKEATELMNE